MPQTRKHLKRTFATAILGTVSTLGLNSAAMAEVTRLEILETQSPSFDGRSFGEVGPYEKITARAYGEIDPQDPRNTVIADIALAPKNANGMVEYSTDVQILKPVDLSKGNHRLFFDVLNRGRKLAPAYFNDAPRTNTPTTAEDAGNGFLFDRGYTLAWAGWQSGNNVAEGDGRMRAEIPVARNANGEPITARVLFEEIFDDEDSTDIEMLFPAASLDANDAKVLVRNSSDGERVELPRSAWSFVGERTVRINRSDPFLEPYDAGAAYEVIYTAKDPEVSGLGNAITRDVASFLRYDESEANPLRDSIRYALAHGTSQSGRMLKGFIHEGFNEDEAGRIVFEGMNVNISGAHAIALNDRFGDANATGRPYQRHTSAKIEFPFTYEVMTDPVSGITDGIFARCRETDTCPRVFHTDSANEAWGKASMLVTTDGLGRDIDLPEDVRVYYFASTQHGPAAEPKAGICQQLSNPNRYQPYLRALWVALDGWATADMRPPESAYPRVGDGTLAPPLPQSVVGFPEIPGVTYNGLINEIAVLDKSDLPYGEIEDKRYVVLAPRVDADGNDLGGIRSIDLEVPLATYTGWGLRRAGFAEGEDCGLQGQYVPFAPTREERLASGDPRLSIEERYRNQGDYIRRVAVIANEQMNERLLLPEDANAIVAKAAESGVGAPREEGTDAEGQ